MTTIAHALHETAAEAPEAPALVTPDGQAMSYADYLRTARRRGADLIGLGVGAGDRVGIWAPNSVEWATAHAAILLVGASVVPINTRYTVREAGHIVDRAGCRVVFSAGRFLGRDYAAELSTTAPDLTVVAIEDPPGASDEECGEVDRLTAAIASDDISHVQFTSGTTGEPKGAMLRHGASVSTSLQWIANTGLRSGDRYPIVAPCSHIAGHKTGLLAALLARATALPEPVLDVADLTARIPRDGISFLQGPPTLFLPILEAARNDPESFATVRVAVTGASVVPPVLVRDLRELIGCEVFTAYGLTETTGVVTMTHPGDAIEVVATTCGQALPGIDVAVVDEAGATVATGMRGEVVVSGPSVMAGYLDDPAATDAAIHDGWLRTGDVGILDDAGRLQIVDRLKDMILVGGLNVYPAEIEHAMLEHPDCAAAAVVGVPDDRLGEVPVAFVVARDPHGSLDGDALLAWCRDRIAKFKLPRWVSVVDSLPTNAAGKVTKHELRGGIRDESATHR